MADNNGPQDPKIIPINRPRLVVPGNTLGQPTKPVQTDPNEPSEYDYQIVLKDSLEIIERGFLIATPTFIGIGMGQGQLELVVPMDQLKYARRMADAAVSPV